MKIGEAPDKELGIQLYNKPADQDSDSLFVTNQPDIVAHAQYCYINYPTIINNIPKSSITYDNTISNQSEIDNKLASFQMYIGLSSNVAGIALAYSYTFSIEEYLGYICILSVLA